MPLPLLHNRDFVLHGLALALFVFVGSLYCELDVKLPSNPGVFSDQTPWYLLCSRAEKEQQEAIVAARETSNAIAIATVKGNAEALEEAMLAHAVEMKEVLKAHQAEEVLQKAQQEEKIAQLMGAVHALEQAQHTGDSQIAGVTMAMAEQQKKFDQIQNQDVYLEKIAKASETIAIIQAQVHGYTSMKQRRMKLGRVIFSLGLLGSFVAYFNPSGVERRILVRTCRSTMGAGVIGGTLALYLILYQL